MGATGELNVGQLARTLWPSDCLLVGCTTHHGTVTAASQWGGPAERKHVRPSLPDSFERRFHDSGLDRFLLATSAHPDLRRPRLERAIGVIYRPDTERASHWFMARLGDQFDAILHLDHTTALEPLERTSLWDEGEPPETYPSGL